MLGIIAKKYQSKLISCLEKIASPFYIKYQLISYFLKMYFSWGVYKHTFLPNVVTLSDFIILLSGKSFLLRRI